MALAIDHVPFAVSDLDEATATFEELGLAPDYGGVHDNGCTHMSVLGFPDGSYVELIAERERGDHGFWPDHIRADAGPAAWCVRVPDIVSECRRVLESGHPVRGPLYGAPEREDGRLVETFRDLYRFPQPVRDSVPGFGRVASFPGQPVALATPDTAGSAGGTGTEDGGSPGWLADGLEQFRECPCACLLGAVALQYPDTYPGRQGIGTLRAPGRGRAFRRPRAGPRAPRRRRPATAGRLPRCSRRGRRRRRCR